ncbi:MAG TPA: YbaB/EbfC family nucleoid-associated protein [Streptosporangiaceae bacterium]|jgi:DNA-binding protein YbaB|nr:YbaB/EbfC family nucleoid-associated protein [Streptosporangiaceae bacterium]
MTGPAPDSLDQQPDLEEEWQVGEFVPASAEGAEVAAGLRDKSARLTAAAATAATVSHAASSDAGQPSEVSVTATGSGQVSKIYVGPKAMHSGAPELAGTLSRLVNEAVHGARQRAGEALQAALVEAGEPDLATALRGAMSSAEQLATQLAGRTVSASSPGRKVTVTANGAEEITGIEFGATALRGYDNVSLAAEIAAAVNGAFEAARRLQDTVTSEAPAASAPDLAEVLHERVSAFHRQMDELDRRLGEVSTGLTGPS